MHKLDIFDYLQNLVNAGADAVAIDNQNNVFLSYYLEQGSDTMTMRPSGSCLKIKILTSIK